MDQITSYSVSVVQSTRNRKLPRSWTQVDPTCALERLVIISQHVINRRVVHNLITNPPCTPYSSRVTLRVWAAGRAQRLTPSVCAGLADDKPQIASLFYSLQYPCIVLLLDAWLSQPPANLALSMPCKCYLYVSQNAKCDATWGRG